MLFKVSVEKEYGFIEDILALPQIQAMVYEKTKNYKYRQEEIKEIAIFMIKEAILKEYEYFEVGTEGKFINFLKRRPLARLHEEINREIFNKRPKWVNGKKTWPIDQEDPEEVTDPDIVGDMVENQTNAFETAEMRMDIAAAIKQLTEDEQKVIVLSFYEQHNDTHIAEILGKPRTTVSSIKQRALAKMKKFMTK